VRSNYYIGDWLAQFVKFFLMLAAFMGHCDLRD